MHTADTAANEILAHVAPLQRRQVPTSRALGLVLHEDVVSPVNLPHWDNSAMDGYAVRADDLQGTPPHEFDIIEEIPAGSFPTRTLEPTQCARIFTGAPSPSGADTVVRQEDTMRLDEMRVGVDDVRDAGRNVR